MSTTLCYDVTNACGVGNLKEHGQEIGTWSERNTGKHKRIIVGTIVGGMVELSTIQHEEYTILQAVQTAMMGMELEPFRK
jgi:hypothetical protein